MKTKLGILSTCISMSAIALIGTGCETVTGNFGTVPIPVSGLMAHSGTGCPQNVDRYYTNYFFNGPRAPVGTPKYANTPAMPKLLIDTCHPNNSSGNITAVKIVQNNMPPTVLACDDNGSTCAIFGGTGSTHSSADATLPTGTDNRSWVRVLIYVKTSTLAPGQTNVWFNWKYHN